MFTRTLIGAVLIWASAGAAASAAMCDFESPTDPFCTSEGMNWTNQGGQPTITGAVRHGGSLSLYNNFNSSIGYSGPPIDTLWMVSWAGFPASSVQLIGPNITVNLTPGVWQQVSLGGASSVTFRPTYGTTSNFGTFAIDDVNTIPEPASMALLGIGALTLARRRGGRWHRA